jgi:hypothetical protein
MLMGWSPTRFGEGKAGNPNLEQLAGGEAASKEREKAAKEAEDRENDLAKIRIDSERRLADFRNQSIRRAGELENDFARQRLDLDRNTAEARRRIESQRQDAELETRRQLLSVDGLTTAGVDLQRRLNEATQQFTERQIQIQEQATDRKVEIERAVEDYKVSVAESIRDILVDASEKMADRMRKGAESAAATLTSSTSGGAMPRGIIARTGNTGQSTGPHLDARWADGRRISAADVDRYLSVNGRNPSSFGVTSGYGPRNLFGRSFHKGVDFGTPSGSGISLKGGASLLRDLGFTGAGGYAVEIDTPQGRMRLLHLQAGSAGRPSAAPARASAAIAAGTALVPAPGMDRIEGARRDLSAALQQNTQAQAGVNFGELIGSRRTEASAVTQELDQQRQTSKEQIANFERMVELQRSGLSPEIAQQRVDIERSVSLEREGLQLIEAQLAKDLQITGIADENRKQIEGQLEAIRARIAAQPEIVEGLTVEQQKLESLKTSYEKKKELISGIAESIGGGVGSALELLGQRTESWGNSLRDISRGVLQDITRQLIQISVVQPIVGGLTNLFGFGGGGGGLGSVASNLNKYAPLPAFAKGGVMTDRGPLPLKSYARGGIANSPQLALYGEGAMNEAYVPLPDGRRIPVALQGGAGRGGNSVSVGEMNITVQNTGETLTPDAQKQIAGQVQRIVLATLINQKRSGGIL